MDPKAILTQVRKANPKITVIGETIEDYWYFGRAQEPSQEDPDVWKFVVERKVTMPGGAANVRRNLSILTGGQVHHLTSEFVTSKHRWWNLDSEKMDFRWDEDTEDRNPFWLERLHQCHENVVISDYGKGMMTWEWLSRASKLLGLRKVIFSPHLRNCRAGYSTSLSPLLQHWIWIMNFSESWELGLRDRSDGGFSGVLPPHQYVVTRGSQNVLWHDGQDRVIPVEWSQMKPPLHAIGIGDVFLASFSAAYFAEIPMREAVEYACWVCRKVLEARRPGTCCIHQEDLQ